MADIQTYSPRKVTDQNRDLLPSTHDPKKRTTYVQITLSEPEIKEAIQNYIRAQVPIAPGDELPVKIIAGRGENGHSAEVVVTTVSYTVASPERPTAPMATFEAVAEDAARRNSENGAPTTQDESDAEDDIEEKVESLFVKTEALPAVMEEAPKPAKKSSLFDNVPPKPAAAAEAAIAAAAPPEAEPTVEEVPVASEIPMKAKSIFDV